MTNQDLPWRSRNCFSCGPLLFIITQNLSFGWMYETKTITRYDEEVAIDGCYSILWMMMMMMMMMTMMMMMITVVIMVQDWYKWWKCEDWTPSISPKSLNHSAFSHCLLPHAYPISNVLPRFSSVRPSWTDSVCVLCALRPCIRCSLISPNQMIDHKNQHTTKELHS